MSPEPEQQHGPAFVAGSPRDVAVVGAGMVGLATAWFLQEAGVQVTVYERDHVGAGASWGNAGWLTPALTAPLPEPAVLRYGLRAVLSPRSPVYLPLRADRTLLRFLAGFVAHSTARRWRRGMAAYVPLNERALEAFDVLAAGGVTAPDAPGDRLSWPASAGSARPRACSPSWSRSATPVRTSTFHPVTGWRARALEPALTDRVGAAVQIHGQRYLHPPEFVRSLAVRGAGARRRDRRGRRRGRPASTGPAGSPWSPATGERQQHDAVVVATGAVLGRAGRAVRRAAAGAGRPRLQLQRAGRADAARPAVLPEAAGGAARRWASRLRVAGMMEFRRPGDPLDPRRITAIVDAVRPFLTGVDLDDRRNEWVGSRPCTPDGLPLLGVTASPRVFVAGGHGMWGIALGPITGQLMAQTVLKGEAPPELAPFDPLR